MFKILVVEDDRDLNQTVCAYLNRNGYEAHEYLHELKNSDDVQYNSDYREYKKKYALPVSSK